MPNTYKSLARCEQWLEQEYMVGYQIHIRYLKLNEKYNKYRFVSNNATISL